MITKITWKNRPRAVEMLAAAYCHHWQNEDIDLDAVANQALAENCAFGESKTKSSNRQRMLKKLHHDAMLAADPYASERS